MGGWWAMMAAGGCMENGLVGMERSSKRESFDLSKYCKKNGMQNISFISDNSRETHGLERQENSHSFGSMSPSPSLQASVGGGGIGQSQGMEEGTSAVVFAKPSIPSLRTRQQRAIGTNVMKDTTSLDYPNKNDQVVRHDSPGVRTRRSVGDAIRPSSNHHHHHHNHRHNHHLHLPHHFHHRHISKLVSLGGSKSTSHLLQLNGTVITTTNTPHNINNKISKNSINHSSPRNNRSNHPVISSGNSSTNTSSTKSKSPSRRERTFTNPDTSTKMGVLCTDRGCDKESCGCQDVSTGSPRPASLPSSSPPTSPLSLHSVRKRSLDLTATTEMDTDSSNLTPMRRRIHRTPSAGSINNTGSIVHSTTIITTRAHHNKLLASEDNVNNSFSNKANNIATTAAVLLGKNGTSRHDMVTTRAVRGLNGFNKVSRLLSPTSSLSTTNTSLHNKSPEDKIRVGTVVVVGTDHRNVQSNDNHNHISDKRSNHTSGNGHHNHCHYHHNGNTSNNVTMPYDSSSSLSSSRCSLMSQVKGSNNNNNNNNHNNNNNFTPLSSLSSSLSTSPSLQTPSCTTTSPSSPTVPQTVGDDDIDHLEVKMCSVVNKNNSVSISHSDKRCKMVNGDTTTQGSTTSSSSKNSISNFQGSRSSTNNIINGNCDGVSINDADETASPMYLHEIPLSTTSSSLSSSSSSHLSSRHQQTHPCASTQGTLPLTEGSSGGKQGSNYDNSNSTSYSFNNSNSAAPVTTTITTTNTTIVTRYSSASAQTYSDTVPNLRHRSHSGSNVKASSSSAELAQSLSSKLSSSSLFPKLNGLTKVNSSLSSSSSTCSTSSSVSAPQTPAIPVQVSCKWRSCNLTLDPSDLLDHVRKHAEAQISKKKYACLWTDCKVYNQPSLSGSWLERHIVSHSGHRPFKCIVPKCGQRFHSQMALERHVNGHFATTSPATTKNGRTREEITQHRMLLKRRKQLKRRSVQSVKTSDFFDDDTMTIVKQQVQALSTTTQLGLSEDEPIMVTFSGMVVGRRTNNSGSKQSLVEYTPSNILEDVWMPESSTRDEDLNELCMPLAFLPHATVTHLHPSLYRRHRFRKHRRK